MNLIETTATHEIFLSHFEGKPVRFIKDRQTGEININADDAAKVLGFDSITDLMSEDGALDIVNQVKKETGKFPLSQMEQPETSIRYFAVRCSNETYTCVYARLGEVIDADTIEHIISGDKTYYPAMLLPEGILLTDELQTLAKQAIVCNGQCVLTGFALEDNTGIVYPLDWNHCQDMGALGMVVLFQNNNHKIYER